MTHIDGIYRDVAYPYLYKNVYPHYIENKKTLPDYLFRNAELIGLMGLLFCKEEHSFSSYSMYSYPFNPFQVILHDSGISDEKAVNVILGYRKELLQSLGEIKAVPENERINIEEIWEQEIKEKAKHNGIFPDTRSEYHRTRNAEWLMFAVLIAEREGHTCRTVKSFAWTDLWNTYRDNLESKIGNEQAKLEADAYIAMVTEVLDRKTGRQR